MANQIRLKRGSGSNPSASDLAVGELAVRTDTGVLFTKDDGGSVITVGGSGSGISDGDKGDITVSNSGDTFTIDNDVVTFAKMQNVTTSRLLGRTSSSTGNIEELTASSVRTLLNVADGATNVTNTNQLTNGAGFITATLTNEQVQDIVGGMVSGNTESGITVTYQDGDGTLDFAVASQTDQNFTTTLKNKLDGIAAGATNVTNTNQLTNGAGFITSADGGNAATLDGIDSSQFVRSDADDTLTGGTYTFDSSTAQKIILRGASSPYIRFQEGTTNRGYIQFDSSLDSMIIVNQQSGEYLRVGSGETGLRYYVDNNERFVWTSGNDGSGSGLDADTLDGMQPSVSTSGNTIVQRHASGYIFANYFNTSPNDIADGAITKICAESGNDGYIRHATAATVRTFLNVANGATNNGSGTVVPNTGGTFTGDVGFSGGAAAIQINGNSDIRFATGNWTGNATKIQHHSNRLYISGGSASDYSIVLRYDSGDKIYMKTNGTFYPANNASSDLGTSSKRWANLYVNDLQLSNKNSGGNSVDGTWGDWTLQEAEDTIFMLNNRNGKKYKMNLTEIV